MNSALNAADKIIVPVDSSVFAFMGIKEMLNELEDIRITNEHVSILGYLLTLADQTRVSVQSYEATIASFGEQVFVTKIRRSVKLKSSCSFPNDLSARARKPSRRRSFTPCRRGYRASEAISQPICDVGGGPCVRKTSAKHLLTSRFTNL